MSSVYLVVFLLFTAVASFIHLEPKNATVLRGSEVHFNCSTDESWDVMTWLLGGRTILTISVEHGPLGRDESVSTVNHSMSSLSVWELVLMNASFSPTVQEVTCELLPTKLGRSSSSLFVQGMWAFVKHTYLNICKSIINVILRKLSNFNLFIFYILYELLLNLKVSGMKLRFAFLFY